MALKTPKGYLCMVLHAHLPYVRHPEYPFFLEENWLFEAISESYIPLLDAFSRLVNDGVDFKITLSLSPCLIEMLNDALLMRRYVTHLERLRSLAEAERKRTKGDARFEPVVRMYEARFKRIQYLFEEAYGGNLISALCAAQAAGHVEIIPSAATHAYLPHLSLIPEAVKAQVNIAQQHYRETFGRSPKGIWLPECGFAPGFDEYIADIGLRYFFLETHGVIRGTPFPQFGPYLPIRCSSGVVAFGRDQEASRQVWSAEGGYPGDPIYREFYRDAGFDVDEDHMKNFLEPYGAKTFTGLKYYRVTGGSKPKEPYRSRPALKRAERHAAHFLAEREACINNVRERIGVRPVITATFDAELLGHWWFEGPDWLEMFLRKAERSRILRMVTPAQYLNLQGGKAPVQVSHPSASSWGEKGYHEVWLNERNDDIYRHLLTATRRMVNLADRFPRAEGILRRALNQAARELLLLQHSDWTFMIKNNTYADYARRRFAMHVGRFARLYESIVSGVFHEEALAEMEEKDRIFPNIDYRVYRRRC